MYRYRERKIVEFHQHANETASSWLLYIGQVRKKSKNMCRKYACTYFLEIAKVFKH